jgi:hypothetical protein
VEQTYTTGQMIDAIYGTERIAVSDHNHKAGYAEGKIRYDDGVELKLTNYVLQRTWRIIEPTPKRTYKDALLERFPKADIRANGMPVVCINRIFGNICDCGDMNCVRCWNSEYKEEEGETDEG